MANSSGDLPDAIYEHVTRLSERGNAFLEAGEPRRAAEVWSEALTLLPPPIEQWDAAMWLNASIGEAHQDMGDHERALASFRAAVNSGGADNAFVWMGIGVSLFNLGRAQEAVDPLLRAYMIDGREIFDEFGGPYLQLLRERKLID